MATAPNTKSAPVAATGKNGAPIRVVTPDQDGNFHLKIAKGDVEKVQVVDVDMVLNLKDGSKLVLAGGALSAMDGNDYVDFSDGKDSASHLLELVGKIELQKFDDSRVLNSEPVNDAPHGGTNDGDANALGQLLNQSQSGNAELSNAINKALGSLEHVVQNNASSINEFQTDYDAYAQPPNKQLEVTIQERPGKTPVEHEVGPSEPTLLISLLNTTGTTTPNGGNVLYGAGGSPASATDPRNSTQFAAQVIHAPDNITEIHATGNIPDNTFVKVASVELNGSGATVQSVVVTGVPAGVQILNADDLGNGSYLMHGVPGQSTYNFQLLYSTAIADASNPIHPPQFSLTFIVEYSTNLGLGNLIQVTPFVIKDASSASDLTYIDATTGATVFVLPAQGIPHEIHAGNNAGTTIHGSNANDLLYGGTGNDTLEGGTGNTYFEGGAGADTIVGGNNGVQIGTTGVFGTNVNTIGYTGSATGVTVNLGTGTSSGGDGTGDVFSNIQNVMGSTHDDTIIVGDTSVKASFVNGGGGSDTLSFENSTAGVTVNLVTHNGIGGNAQNTTFSNIENLKGSSFDDTFVADNFGNHFDGGAGGSDTVSYEASTAGVIVNLASSTQSGVAASSGAGGYAGTNASTTDTYTNIENVIGTKFDDVFVANSAVNVFNGGAGGNDTVSYAASANGVTVSFAGGRGSDAVVGQASDAAGDRYINIQNVIGSAHNDIFFAGFDSISFNGGGVDFGGYDTVNYNFSDAAVTINTINNAGTGGWAQGNIYSGITKFVGSSYSDTFIGSATVNQFDGGGGGSDTIDYHFSNNTALTIDLFNGVGSGGDAQGDTYTHIQNAIGSGGNDVFIANSDANSLDGRGGSNTVSYANATDAVTVDLYLGTGSANYAQGDTYTNIQNVIGGVYDDTFIANGVANKFDGGDDNSTNTSHNRVSYINDTVGVTVDLFHAGAAGSGGLAAGDTYTHIQDVTGGSGNDTFIASAAANNFDGSGGTHNRVSYTNDTVGVTVDLSAPNTAGVGGLAEGDKYTNIQDVTGGSGNDLFVASLAENSFDGGTGNNTVSYQASTTGVIVNLSNGATTVGATAVTANHGSGGYANNDAYTNIQNVIGSTLNDTFVGSSAANVFTGNGGSDTVSYASSGTGVIVNLSDGTLETIAAKTGGGASSDALGDTYVGISNAIGSNNNDVIMAATTLVGTYDGGTGGTHDRVSYGGFANDLIVNLSGTSVTVGATTVAGGKGDVGKSGQDTYVNIEDATGGSGNDLFIAGLADNNFDGGSGNDTVSYIASNAGVTVNLSGTTQGGVTSLHGSGGYANNDAYANIENVTGSNFNDTFYANGSVNTFDGVDNTNGTSHNRVSYAGSNATDLIINLSGTSVTVGATTVAANTGSGGDAQGDKYLNIQDATGAGGNDTFVASSLENNIDGGGGNNTVSYQASTAGVIVNLSGGTVGGVTANHGSGGYANNDAYTNIQNVTGSTFNDTFIGGSAANVFTGNGGSDTVNYASSGTGVIVNLSDGALETIAAKTGGGASSDALGDTYVGISNAIGSNNNDVIMAATTLVGTYDGGTGGTHDRVSYGGFTNDLTINLSDQAILGVNAGKGNVGKSGQDTYVSIEDATGGSGSDTFIAGSAANFFNGGSGGSDTVNYQASGAGVIANLSGGTQGGVATMSGGGNTGSYAIGDTYQNIQNVTGSNFNDTFYANGSVNTFNGVDNTNGTSHNLVSYAGSNNTNLIINLSGTAVTVGATNVAANKGSGGDAEGDTYLNIQDATGAGGNDTFVASSLENNIDGGGGNNTVSYQASTAGVIVNLSGNAVTLGATTVAVNKGSGGDANNDSYTSIQNVIGSTQNDTFIGGSAANVFTGNGGSDTVNYASSGTGVIVNLSDGALETIAAKTGGGATSDALGDTYVGISNVTGSSNNDVIMAATTLVGTYDGGSGGAHDRVSYGGFSSNLIINLSDASVTVNSTTVAAGKGAVGKSGQDTYVSIEDATGGSGSDTFIAGSAANFFNGGSGGSDTVNYQASGAGVIVNLSGGTQGGVATMSGGGNTGSYAIGDTYQNIQNVTGSNFNDTFYANGSVNTFNGVDNTNGTSHNLVSYVGSDNSNLVVNLSNASVAGVGAGRGNGGDANNDTYINIQDITTAGGNDLLIASSVANNLDGGGGNNTVSYAASTAGVTVNLSSNAVGAVAAGHGSNGYANNDTYVNIQNIVGSAQADILIGLTAGGTTFTGGAGGDTLTGNGLGNTASYVGSAAVQVDLFYTDGTNTLGGDAAGDKLSGVQNLIGTANNDVFYASVAGNSFTGNGTLGVQAGDLAVTGAGGDTVNYSHSDAGVTVNLSTNTASGGFANGDSFTGITNLVGSAFGDTLTGLTGGGSTLTGGAGADTLNGLGTNNTITYIGSTAGVNVDLYTGAGAIANTGGDAAGDVISNIQNIIGSGNNDLFYASLDANKFTGNGGVDTVSYLHSTSGVTVNLSDIAVNGLATLTGSGGFAQGDTYVGIQNVTGSNFNDTFVASNQVNEFKGGGGSDTVDYTASGNNAVQVDLFHGTGTGGYAAGDTYTNIQNVIGGAGNDTFYANASINAFNGAGGTDTVSYQYSITNAIVADLINGGTGGVNSDSNGDTYINIENLTGSAFVNSTLTGNAGDNVLTALGNLSTSDANGNVTTNILNGGDGNDTLDGRVGGHNTLNGGVGNDDILITANGNTNNQLNGNVASLDGGTGSDTVHITNLGTSLDLTNFVGKVTNIEALDLTSSTNTNLSVTGASVASITGVTNGFHLLTINLKTGETVSFSGENVRNGSDYTSFYALNDPGQTGPEIARIHLNYV